MKKLLLLFFLAIALILGIIIGSPDRDTASTQIRDDIEEFEGIITEPGNQYDPQNRVDIDPNLSNSIAKKGENIISDVFDFMFRAINSLMED
jgi:predicted PurR-regulated permease PerM